MFSDKSRAPREQEVIVLPPEGMHIYEWTMCAKVSQSLVSPLKIVALTIFLVEVIKGQPNPIPGLIMCYCPSCNLEDELSESVVTDLIIYQCRSFLFIVNNV